MCGSGFFVRFLLLVLLLLVVSVPTPVRVFVCICVCVMQLQRLVSFYCLLFVAVLLLARCVCIMRMCGVCVGCMYSARSLSTLKGVSGASLVYVGVPPGLRLYLLR